jgi:hypothetical protein
VAEDPVADHRIDDRREDHGVDHVGAELEPLQGGAPHDRERHGAEDELEEQQRRRADGGDVEQRELLRGLRRHRADVEEEAVGPGDLPRPAEGESKAHGPVAERRDREVGQDLDHPEAGVLRTREAHLEEQEPGLHEHDEHGGHDHPGGVHGRDRVVESGSVSGERRAWQQKQSERHTGRQGDTSHGS